MGNFAALAFMDRSGIRPCGIVHGTSIELAALRFERIGEQLPVIIGDHLTLTALYDSAVLQRLVETCRFEVIGIVLDFSLHRLWLLAPVTQAVFLGLSDSFLLREHHRKRQEALAAFSVRPIRKVCRTTFRTRAYPPRSIPPLGREDTIAVIARIVGAVFEPTFRQAPHRRMGGFDCGEVEW